jgi:hypothetical protein
MLVDTIKAAIATKGSALLIICPPGFFKGEGFNHLDFSSRINRLSFYSLLFGTNEKIY